MKKLFCKNIRAKHMQTFDSIEKKCVYLSIHVCTEINRL